MRKLLVIPLVFALACGSHIQQAGALAGALAASVSASPTSTPKHCVEDGASAWSSGTPRFTTLPNVGQAQRVAFSGSTLLTTAIIDCTHELALWRVDTKSATVTAEPLGLMDTGAWGGLDVGPDGSVWASGAASGGDAIARVHADGSVEVIPVPPAQFRLPQGFRGPPPPNASPALPPFLNGQLTSLVAFGDRVLIGRAGFSELTVYLVNEQRFEHVQLPFPLGDVDRLARSGQDMVMFTINRSVQDPTHLYDALGRYDAGGQVTALPVVAREVAGTAGAFALASNRGAPGADQIILRTDTAGSERAASPSSAYDTSRLAIRDDGLIAVRLIGNAHGVAFIDASGREVKRVEYAAVESPGHLPYAGTFAFAAFGPDGALWFGLVGRPDIYRIVP